MKKLLLSFLLITLSIIIIGCSNGNNDTTYEAYNDEDFNISLININGENVNISPDQKTIYAYFTGIG
ncbi:hypothetical protein QA612_01870 [Evansella sp. AB-P1]|uniref:hypothetical protein n=1 Tax=Evansella sp. AB-P1 TaxID=3037653 RepID=UPI00241DD646|nr:hypothetical protein [Evansella sp. AB-P1]MDG5786220.1 hypothetical protein [Evansella sp. AB-P1]